jgi:methylenetetrahydrofolate dehydrogenase (NADP+)/methenyltetrahydrofolate cyclohydrolase
MGAWLSCLKYCISGLLDRIVRLNPEAGFDGILVQLPLPQEIDSRLVIEAIDPDKDVDGFHPFNVGDCSRRRSTPSECLFRARRLAA